MVYPGKGWMFTLVSLMSEWMIYPGKGWMFTFVPLMSEWMVYSRKKECSIWFHYWVNEWSIQEKEECHFGSINDHMIGLSTKGSMFTLFLLMSEWIVYPGKINE